MNIKSLLSDVTIVENIIEFSKRVNISGGKVNLYELIAQWFKDLQKDEITERAGGVAFDFTLSLFPAIIFLFTLIPYIPVDNLDGKIMSFMSDVMPLSTYEAASETINDIVSKQRGSLLSFGFLFALVFATNGMASLMKAFNNIYMTVENRGFLKMRGIAALLTFLLALALFSAIIFLIVGQFLLDQLVIFLDIRGDHIIFFIYMLRTVVIFLLFYVVIASVYYFGPAVKNRWRFFSLGSFVASGASIATSLVFSIYVSNFGTYNQLYGSIGALIAIMVWLYLQSIIILAGFELNASKDKVEERFLAEGKSEMGNMKRKPSYYAGEDKLKKSDEKGSFEEKNP
jgi:membrane protein